MVLGHNFKQFPLSPSLCLPGQDLGNLNLNEFSFSKGNYDFELSLFGRFTNCSEFVATQPKHHLDHPTNPNLPRQKDSNFLFINCFPQCGPELEVPSSRF